MKQEEEIYKMNLLEVKTISGVTVCRVPGGWIMGYSEENSADVFVPFDNEFINGNKGFCNN